LPTFNFLAIGNTFHQKTNCESNTDFTILRARVRRMDGYQGAARLHTKTVEEMAEEKEASRCNAQAADKGKMTANA
jgi:hypothetical protein